MPDTTKYEKLTNYFLDNWIFSVIILILVIIAFIPSLRDGIVEIFKILKKIFVKSDKSFVIEVDGETITFENKIRSKLFDIIKINATTHSIGVRAEYLWINKNYPNFRIESQAISNIKINKNQSLKFDTLTIVNNENEKKRIYFDIRAFYNNEGHTSINVEKFAIAKISELYS